MPTEGEHVAQVEQNEQVYQFLATVAPAFSDGQTTSLFYAALRYVDAYLAHSSAQSSGIHPTSHSQRNSLGACLLGEVYADYRFLEVASRNARYDLLVPPDVSVLYAQEFMRLRAIIRERLGLSQWLKGPHFAALIPLRRRHLCVKHYGHQPL